MTRDEIVDFLEWAKECGQLQFPESRKVDMAEMYIKEQDAVNKTCNIPHVSNCTVLEKPTMEKYGWHTQSGFDDEPSGWMYEGGEEAYYEALKKWEAQQ